MPQNPSDDDDATHLDELQKSRRALKDELDKLAAQGFPLVAKMLRANMRFLCGLRANE